MTINFIRLNLNFLLGAILSSIIINQDAQLIGMSCLVALLNIIPSSFFCMAQRFKYKPFMLLTLYYLPWILVWTILIILIISSGKPISEHNNHRFELLVLCISFFGTLMSSRAIHNLLTAMSRSSRKNTNL